jgi:hypothetical protein
MWGVFHEKEKTNGIEREGWALPPFTLPDAALFL